MSTISVAHNTPQNQPTNITISFVMRGGRHTYWITELTPKCWIFTNLHNHKTAQFRSAEALWEYFGQLIDHLRNKPTANQQKAISDFLKASEDYFKQFSQLVNSKVSNYTRRGMEWNLGNYANDASNAAWRYVTYAQQGI